MRASYPGRQGADVQEWPQRVEANGMDPSPLWHQSIRHTFILAHYVTPLKWGWVHSISLGQTRSFPALKSQPVSGHSNRRFRTDGITFVELDQ